LTPVQLTVPLLFIFIDTFHHFIIPSYIGASAHLSHTQPVICLFKDHHLNWVDVVNFDVELHLLSPLPEESYASYLKVESLHIVQVIKVIRVERGEHIQNCENWQNHYVNN
jgi:hypothetical protein